ncbi:MAG: leucine--tRNA ligase [Actinobacteria bacterium RBG_16_68_21]|nr:MAG: leucine--tRNA ligase [Actinobacteria bacterium RBG_16_68_21]
MAGYDHQTIERKWQAYWDGHHTFRAPNPGDADFDGTRPKLYVLDMFPYPSGEGLHVGHPVGYIGSDIFARFQRMRGYNVLHPMGFDAFGLPAEQYAVETGIHPRVTTERNVANFQRQLKAFGLSYDWTRTFATIDPDYYRWTQWIFLRLFESWFDPDERRARPIAVLIGDLEEGRRHADGAPWASLDAAARRRFLDGKRLAYLDEVMVNWCPALGTVLANEEVTRDGRSDRGDHPVYRRPLRQWMLRITEYADRLLQDLDLLEWPESVKVMQRNWIGRSDGAVIRFPVAGSDASIEVFTTRPDTVFGATYMVLAPEHPLGDALAREAWPEATNPSWTGGNPDPMRALSAYRAAAARKSEVERQAESKEKTGVFTGTFCVNPVNGEHIPVFVADYVLMGYGTGAIMAVPGQDERDWEFAEQFDLPIVRTVEPLAGFSGKAYLGEGAAINSGFLDGLDVASAKRKIIEWLVANACGEATVSYKLRDWLFSRQRYWGEPIPILHGPDGELRALTDAELPLLLPEIDDYRPAASDDENADPVPALARVDESWRHVEIGGVRYERELNTMPQWAGSCWYYLRFADPANPDALVGTEAERYWMGEHGVDLYVGGVEHAVLHLLYARFWHKVLFDLGHVSTPEPFGRLFNQGYILADAYQDSRGVYVPAEKVEERDGAFWFDGEPVERSHGKMGKSLKNSVSPDDFFAEYGMDTLRLYEMFMGPLDTSKPWTTRDIVGIVRFLQRLWRSLIDPETDLALVSDEPAVPELRRLLHRTIKAVTEDMAALRFNTAVARFFELNNALVGVDRVPREVAEAFVLMLAPMAPHVAEELWERLGHQPSIAYVPWPEYDPELAREETVTMVVQVNGKVRDRIEVSPEIGESEARSLALASERVQVYLSGEPDKVIVRAPTLVNVVVR